MRQMIATAIACFLSMPALAQMSDERQIVNTINNVGYYADQLDWEKVAAQFHPDGVVLDYRAGAEAEDPKAKDLPKMSPAQIVAAWKALLPGFDRTHHMIASETVTIDGDQAIIISNVYATHFLDNDGEDSWVFIGDYQHALTRTADGWKITLMRANKRAELGNANLPNLAMERVKASQ